MALLALLFSVAFAAQPNAYYMVPGPADGSAPTAYYPLPDFSVTGDAGARVVSFSLSDELLGPNHGPLMMSEVAGSNPPSFAGAGISAACASPDSTGLVACKMAYTPGYTAVDSNTVIPVLQSRYGKQPQKLLEKMAVFASFVRDPEGVFYFVP